MLFDLRARGRRRTVQAVYLTLAIILGGGLVFFGIGSDAGQGGLVDGIVGQGGGDAGAGAIKDEVEKARERVRVTPRDPAGYALLAQSTYQYAAVGDGFDEETGGFTPTGQARLAEAERAWDRHLELAGDRADPDVAAIMRNAFNTPELNRPPKAVRAHEVYLASLDDAAFGDYAQYAVLAYAAGQTNKGDNARARALELAPKSQRSDLRSELDAAKNQGAGGAPGASGAAGPGGAPGGALPGAPAPVTPSAPAP